MKNNFPQMYSSDLLKSLEREFKFEPIINNCPKFLQKKEIEDFNQKGFLTGIQLFDDDQIQKIRNYFDTILETTLATGNDSYSISTAHLKYKKVHDILINKRLIDFVRDLLGENIIGWGSHFFCKLPNDHRQITWHQDATYWPFSKTRTITCWLAIDNSTIENGCMKVISGSHLFGMIDYEMSKKEENNVLNQTAKDIEHFGKVENIELSAGQISIHSDLLLHSSEPNMSMVRRCGLSLRFCTPDVIPYEGWHAKGIVVSGVDHYNNWLNPSFPQNDYE